MNLKELIKEVERIFDYPTKNEVIWLQGIRQTVEAIDNEVFVYAVGKKETFKDWHKLKKLLGVK